MTSSYLPPAVTPKQPSTADYAPRPMQTMSGAEGQRLSEVSAALPKRGPALFLQEDGLNVADLDGLSIPPAPPSKVLPSSR